MSTQARVVVCLPGTNVLAVEELALPDPGPHQVVVKQFSSGICHSQLHNIHSPRSAPMLLGHESTGVVLAAGSEVSHVSEGDTVFVTWVPRNIAAAQRTPDIAKVERPGTEGAASRNVFTWADHTIADEQYVVKVPEDVPTDVTAIIGCAVMTGAGAVLNTAGVQRGESVAIYGVGGVGLSAVIAAHMVGADPIIAVDIDDDKLAFARRFGASHTVNAATTNAVEAIRALTPAGSGWDYAQKPVAGADYAFDCIGRPKTMAEILLATRSGAFGEAAGGTAVLVGVPQTDLTFDVRHLLMNEKKYIASLGGSCQPDRDFPIFLGWHREGTLPLEQMVTRTYSIDQINEACDDLDAGRIAGRAIMTF